MTAQLETSVKKGPVAWFFRFQWGLLKWEQFNLPYLAGFTLLFWAPIVPTILAAGITTNGQAVIGTYLFCLVLAAVLMLMEAFASEHIRTEGPFADGTRRFRATVWAFFWPPAVAMLMLAFFRGLWWLGFVVLHLWLH